MDHLRVYLEKTATPRSGQEVFISFHKPQAPVSRSSFVRWLKTTLAAAGVNSDHDGSHKTRAASCSAAAKEGLSLITFLKAAAWSSHGSGKMVVT